MQRICLQRGRPRFDSRVGKIPGRRDRLPPPAFLGVPGGSDNKESACNAGDLGLIPGSSEDPLQEGVGAHASILAWDAHGQRAWRAAAAGSRGETPPGRRAQLRTLKKADVSLGDCSWFSLRGSVGFGYPPPCCSLGLLARLYFDSFEPL